MINSCINYNKWCPVMNRIHSYLHAQVCKQNLKTCIKGYYRNVGPQYTLIGCRNQQRTLVSTSRLLKYHGSLCSDQENIWREQNLTNFRSRRKLKLVENESFQWCWRRKVCNLVSGTDIQPSRYEDFLLESWFFEVSSFGKLNLNCHFPSLIEILDPQQFPNQNKACVYLFHEDILENEESEGIVDAPPVQRLRDVYRLNMNLNEKTSELDVRTDLPGGVHLPLVCLIQIPVKFDLEVKNESDVVVREFESERIKIVSQNGNCYMSNLKAGNVEVLCENGDIVSEKAVHGNIHLTAKSGDISADRLQGTTIDCHTDEGNIDIKANYSDSSKFLTRNGDIRLQNCHGNSEITIMNGRLIIDTLDGDLNAVVKKGSASVYVARHSDISLSVPEGDVSLKVPEVLNSTLDLTAKSINLKGMSSSLVSEENNKKENCQQFKGFHGDGSGRITLASETGNITVETQDWCSSLGLKFRESD